MLEKKLLKQYYYNKNNNIILMERINIGIDFVKYYYNHISVGTIDQMIHDGVIKEYSKLRIRGVTYEGNEMINRLREQKNGMNINIGGIEVFDSGSRQLHILLNGKNNDISFSQSFLLVYGGESLKSPIKWVLVNTIIL